MKDHPMDSVSSVTEVKSQEDPEDGGVGLTADPKSATLRLPEGARRPGGPIYEQMVLQGILNH